MTLVSAKIHSGFFQLIWISKEFEVFRDLLIQNFLTDSSEFIIDVTIVGIGKDPEMIGMVAV